MKLRSHRLKTIRWTFGLLICFLSSLSSFASKITIKTINSVVQETEVKVFLPFNRKYYNHNVVSYIYKLKNNDSYTIDIPQDSPVFIRIVISSEPIYLLMAPNDSLKIEANMAGEKAPTNISWINFSGDNSDGHKMFNKYFLYPYQASKFDFITDFFSRRYSDTSHVQKEAKKIIQDHCNGFDSLFQNKIITSTFNNGVKKTIAANLIHEFVKPFLRQHKNISVYSSQSQDSIVACLFNLLPPNDSFLSSGVFTSAYTQSYYTWQEMKLKNVLNENKIKDTVVSIRGNKPLKLSRHYTCFLHGKVDTTLEYSWGSLMLRIAEMFPSEIKSEDIEIFKWYFQNSIYVKLLSHFINDEMPSTTLQAANNKETIIFIDSSRSITTIKQLVAQHFTGKNVFIDMWATWCAPCKIEFRNELHTVKQLFEETSIIRLYVSIDKAAMTRLWEKDIHRFNLTGYHILASEALADDMKVSFFSKDELLSIPRYILINKSGEVVNFNLPRPSSSELVKYILSLRENKKL
jgi:thiol-disulfide isomerase/thioredoxin